jgi:hypothetical protein
MISLQFGLKEVVLLQVLGAFVSSGNGTAYSSKFVRVTTSVKGNRFMY